MYSVVLQYAQKICFSFIFLCNKICKFRKALLKQWLWMIWFQGVQWHSSLSSQCSQASGTPQTRHCRERSCRSSRRTRIQFALSHSSAVCYPSQWSWWSHGLWSLCHKCHPHLWWKSWKLSQCQLCQYWYSIIFCHN